MSKIVAFALDTSRGVAAAGVGVSLLAQTGDDWQVLAYASTGSDGTLDEPFPDGLQSGAYRLTYDLRSYFEQFNIDPLYPHVQIDFTVAKAGECYVLPIVFGPHSYSTYRGSE